MLAIPIVNQAGRSVLIAAAWRSFSTGGMSVIQPSLTMLGVSIAFLSTLLPALRGERR